MGSRTGADMADKTTLSLIKADVGSIAGHQVVHPRLEETARASLKEAVSVGVIEDFHVTHAGDDLQLIMTHRNGVDSSKVHELAWLTFEKATKVAKELHLYGAGQDLLAGAFRGNVRGMGPGGAELEDRDGRAPRGARRALHDGQDGAGRVQPADLPDVRGPVLLRGP